MHQDRQPGSRNLRDLATRRARQLRDGGRSALWGNRGRRRRRVRGRRPAVVRRRMLQPGMRSVRADGRAHLPAGQRVPRRRGPVRARRRLLRVCRLAGGIRNAGDVRHQRPGDHRSVQKPDGLQAERRRVQAKDDVVQLVVRLLRRQLRDGGHVPSGQPGCTEMLPGAVRGCGRSLRVERRLLQWRAVRTEPGRRCGSSVRMQRDAVCGCVRWVHGERRLLPRIIVPRGARGLGWLVRPLRGRDSSGRRWLEQLQWWGHERGRWGQRCRVRSLRPNLHYRRRLLRQRAVH